MSKKKLYITTIMSMVIFFSILAGLLLLLSKTLYYMQGWCFWAAFCFPTTFISLYFLKYDPELIERRISPTETRPQQIVGQSLAALLFFGGIIAFPAWDYGESGAKVLLVVSLIADLFVMAGFVIVFLVFKENTFTSRTIEHMEGQKVITTGPYSKVRHPMYSGALLIIIATPISLGSLWGLIASAFLVVIVIVRLLDEEKMLRNELAGYSAYCETQPYRLIPHIW